MNTTPQRYGFVTRILNLIPAGHRAFVVVVAILAAIAYLMLTGCASLAAPETAEQRLAYVDSQFTGLVESAADLRDSGALDADQAAELTPLIDRGDRLLDTAWSALNAGEISTVDGALEQLQQLIPQIRQHLENASEQNDTGAQSARSPDDHRQPGTAAGAGRVTADSAGRKRRPGAHRPGDLVHHRSPQAGGRSLARAGLTA